MSSLRRLNRASGGTTLLRLVGRPGKRLTRWWMGKTWSLSVQPEILRNRKYWLQMDAHRG
jgi:hypothetical protein